MGLITLIVIIAFTAFYLGRSMEGNRPEQLTLVVDKMIAHIDLIAKWSGIYGVAAAALTLVMRYTPGDMLIRLVCNVLICLMALPFIFNRLTEKYHGKVNAAIMEEAKNVVGWISRNEKYVSYIAAACSAILFFTIFK
jgi:hypothetical protein